MALGDVVVEVLLVVIPITWLIRKLLETKALSNFTSKDLKEAQESVDVDLTEEVPVDVVVFLLDLTGPKLVQFLEMKVMRRSNLKNTKLNSFAKLGKMSNKTFEF